MLLPIASNNPGISLQFLITERTTIHEDGTIVLSALDSQVIGTVAKLESHPGSHRIGFWSKATDHVVWDFLAPGGRYSAEFVYSRANGKGTALDISIGSTAAVFVPESTRSWYHYRVDPLGDFMLPQSEMQHAEVRVKQIINGGVVNLKAIILTPADKPK